MRNKGGSKGERGEVLSAIFDARLDIKMALAASLLEHPDFHLIEGSEKDNSHLRSRSRAPCFVADTSCTSRSGGP
jgi:hypothetical protein